MWCIIMFYPKCFSFFIIYLYRFQFDLTKITFFCLYYNGLYFFVQFFKKCSILLKKGERLRGRSPQIVAVSAPMIESERRMVPNFPICTLKPSLSKAGNSSTKENFLYVFFIFNLPKCSRKF